MDINKKTFFLIIISLFFINFISANLGTFQQNGCVNIKTILNTSSVTLSTLSYPNSTLAISNQTMDKTSQTFNYSFCNTSSLGVYTYDYYDSEGNVYVNSFNITPNGEDLTTGKGVLFIFFILGVLFIFCISLYFSITIPYHNQVNDEGFLVSINDLKYVKIGFMVMDYLLMLMFFGLSQSIFSNYVYESGVSWFFNYGYQILFALLYPIIICSIIFIFILFINDKKLQKKLERGLDILQ